MQQGYQGHGDPFGKQRQDQEKALADKHRQHFLTEGLGKRIRDSMEANGRTEKEITDMLDYLLESKASRDQAENLIENMKAEAQAKTATNPNWRTEERKQQEQQEYETQQAKAQAEQAKELETLKNKTATETPKETTIITKEPSKPISSDTILISCISIAAVLILLTVSILIGKHIREEWNK